MFKNVKHIKLISLLLFLIILMIMLLSACKNSISTEDNNTSITLSDGSDIASIEVVTVPNMIGKDYKSAKQSLESIGLRVRLTYKILQVKEIVDGEAIYYDNNIIIDQSHNQGTVVANGTEIELTVNQWNEFIYDINGNNTITLTGLGNSLYYPNKQLYIPKEYNGYKVYCVKSDLLNSKQTDAWGNTITYLIPTDVIIDGETSVKIIRY